MLLFNSPATGIRNLWIMPLAGAGAPRQVTFFPAPYVTHAALSADGARVAYTIGETTGMGRGYVLSTAGGTPQQVCQQCVLYGFISDNRRVLAVLRLEDPTLLTGEGKYVDDIVEPGMLHVSYVRSTVAHANLVSVDISGAASIRGTKPRRIGPREVFAMLLAAAVAGRDTVARPD